MKKLFTFFAAFCLTTVTFAQQIPNGGMENWTVATRPNSWTTVEDAFGNLGFYADFAKKDTAASNVHSGLASLRMKQDTAAGVGPSLPGVACLGTNKYIPGVNIIPYYAYNKRPDTLYFSYKMTDNNNKLDTSVVHIWLTKHDTTKIMDAGEYALLDSTNQWVNVALPLTGKYLSAMTPDSLHLIFSAGKNPNSHRKATIWIDDIYLNAAVTVTGIADAPGVVQGVNAYPNPANNEIHIHVSADEIGSPISLYDMSGREVYTGMITTEHNSIDTHGLSSGLYTVRVHSTDHITVYSGKVSIAH